MVVDGDTVAPSGFVNVGFPEELAVALEGRFVENSSPKELTLVYAAGQGDGKDRGPNHFTAEGLVIEQRIYRNFEEAQELAGEGLMAVRQNYGLNPSMTMTSPRNVVPFLDLLFRTWDDELVVEMWEVVASLRWYTGIVLRRF